MKRFISLLLLAAATVCFGDSYSKFVTSNVALRHGVQGPLDFSQLFLSQADLDYYCSTGGITAGVSEEWLATKPLPYDGQVVSLAIDGSEPKVYVLRKKDDGMYLKIEMGTAQSIANVSTAVTEAKAEAIDTAKSYVNQFAKKIYQIKGATNTVAQIEAFENPETGDVWYARDTKSLYVYTDDSTWVELPTAIDLSKYSTTTEMNSAIATATSTITADVAAKRGLLDEYQYNEEWDLSPFEEAFEASGITSRSVRFIIKSPNSWATVMYEHSESPIYNNWTIANLTRVETSDGIAMFRISNASSGSYHSSEGADYSYLNGTLIKQIKKTTNKYITDAVLNENVTNLNNSISTKRDLLDNYKYSNWDLTKFQEVFDASGITSRTSDFVFEQINASNARIYERVTSDPEMPKYQAAMVEKTDEDGEEVWKVAGVSYTAILPRVDYSSLNGLVITNKAVKTTEQWITDADLKVATNNFAKTTLKDATNALVNVTLKNATNELVNIFDDKIEVINDKLNWKRDKTDEFTYSLTETDWDLSALEAIESDHTYYIDGPNSDGDDIFWIIKLRTQTADSNSGQNILTARRLTGDTSTNPEKLVIDSAITMDDRDTNPFAITVGTIIKQTAKLTGDTLAHEGLKADSVEACVEESEWRSIDITGGTTNVRVQVSEALGGVPIRNLKEFTKRDFHKLRLYFEGSDVYTNAVAISDLNAEPSLRAMFNLPDGNTITFKITSSNVWKVVTSDETTTFVDAHNLVTSTRIAKDSQRLNGLTGEEWFNKAKAYSASYADTKVANVDLSVKRSLDDEYVYASDWDLSFLDVTKLDTDQFPNARFAAEYTTPPGIWNLFVYYTEDDVETRAWAAHLTANGTVDTATQLTVSEFNTSIAGVDFATLYPTLASKVITKKLQKNGDKLARLTDLKLTDNITPTKTVGNVTAGVEIECAGKSVQWLFEQILAKDIEPTVTAPSITSFSMSPNNTALEVGSKSTPTYSITASLGSYTYGVLGTTGSTASGCAWTEILILDNNGREFSKTSTSGSLEEIDIMDSTEYYLTQVVGTYSAGGTPQTYNKNTAAVSGITAGSVTKTANTGKITGYRKYFIFVGSKTTAMTSANLRNSSLTAYSGNGKTVESVTLDAFPANVTRVAIAVPNISGYKVPYKFVNNGTGYTEFSFFAAPITVNVDGANNRLSAEYNVYIWDRTDDEGPFDTGASYTAVFN